MKIKNKLAKAYSEANPGVTPEQAFLAGFEAAKEIGHGQMQKVMCDDDIVFYKGEALRLNLLELGETDES